MNSPACVAPDEAALRADLESTTFLAGVAEGRWAMHGPSGIEFPHIVIWVSAAARPGGPTCFWLRMNLAGYRPHAPTAMLWDPETRAQLELAKYPKGGGDVGKVFRTDWPSEGGGTALYHPMDRRPLSDHADWKTVYAGQAWTARRTVVDYLEMVYGLLNSPNYRGV